MPSSISPVLTSARPLSASARISTSSAPTSRASAIACADPASATSGWSRRARSGRAAVTPTRWPRLAAGSPRAARLARPSPRLGRPPERVRVVAQLDRQACRSRGVAARARETVATHVRLDRGLRIELVTRGETRPLVGASGVSSRASASVKRTRASPHAPRASAARPPSIALLGSSERVANQSAPPRATRGQAALRRSDVSCRQGKPDWESRRCLGVWDSRAGR